MKSGARSPVAMAAMGLAAALWIPISTSQVRAADAGCPPKYPFGCTSTYCCEGKALHHCKGYTGTDEKWKKLRNFCTNRNTDEAVADLRSNCAEFVSCSSAKSSGAKTTKPSKSALDDLPGSDNPPAVPDVPPPTCESCDPGYHCVHNPEGCEADAEEPVNPPSNNGTGTGDPVSD